MPDIQVVYFDLRGRGEVIRLLLHLASQPFDDVRIPLKSWGPEKKADAPYGQLPYIVYKGKKYGQSLPIANFLARKFSLHGKTEEECLRIDEVAHLADDLRFHIRAWRLETDPEKKAAVVLKLREEVFPHYLGYFEAMLAENGSTGFIVGSSVTLGDLVIFDVIDNVIALDCKEILSQFPCHQKLRNNIENIPTLKEYLQKRNNSI